MTDSLPSVGVTTTNLKGQTDAFVVAAERRVQGLHMGINRTMYQYETMEADVTQSTDGEVNNPETVSQLSIAAQVGEWKELVVSLV